MITVILMMAGNASRMHMNENKVYLSLGSQRIFEYTLKLFLSYEFEVICVIRKEDRAFLTDYEGRIKIVYGGHTRQESVFNGLKEATGEYVLIHDAARPFLSKQLLEACIRALQQDKACIVVKPCKDTIYQRNPFTCLIRDSLALAQTPQGAKRKDLLEAHICALKDQRSFTDDISLLLNYKNVLVELVEGEEANFKITTQLDYIIAKEWLKHV